MEKIQFFLCGGAVRDQLMGFKPKDFDYVVLASSFDEMKTAIVERGGTIFLEKPEFLTIRGKLPGIGGADFVLPRVDGDYSDNRRPDSTFVATSLFEDSCRRDLTINAIYQNMDTGEIIDYHNGQQDLKNGVLRCVGDPYERFSEDFLRILRIFRFAITKNFSICDKEKKCLRDYDLIKGLHQIAVERIYEELAKTFRFDTYGTWMLFDQFISLRDLIFHDIGIKLKPTLEK